MGEWRRGTKSTGILAKSQRNGVSYDIRRATCIVYTYSSLLSFSGLLEDVTDAGCADADLEKENERERERERDRER